MKTLTLVLLVAVLVVGFALLIIVGSQWQENRVHFNASPSDAPSLAQFESYRDRADTLQKLTSLLIGMSALYAAVLGVTTYLTAQQLIDRAKESAAKIESRETELEKNYPMLADFSDAVDSVVRELRRLLLVDDERMDALQKLSAYGRARILYFEGSVAYFEFLNVEPQKKDISQIYQAFGKFYGARGARRRADLETQRRHATGNPQLTRLLDSLLEANAHHFDTARFYFEKARAVDQTNVAALNDLGYLWYRDLRNADKATEIYEESNDQHPRQQRALYNMAAMKMDAKDFAAAEPLLQRAAHESNWQTAPSRERTADVHYNRACCCSRLAEAAQDQAGRERLLDRTEGALREALQGMNAELTDTWKGDVKPNGDLHFFARSRPKTLAEFERRFGGA